MSIYNPDYIQLSVLGSRTVRIAATPSAFDDGAVTVWVECAQRTWNPDTQTLDPERTAYTLTENQARELVHQITKAAHADRGLSDLRFGAGIQR